MNTLTWRLLTAEELTRVYLNEMRRDFPPTELKPLSMVLNSEAVGDSHTWGVYDGEALVAYLLMVRPRGATVSQLDYFAVLPACRAAGLGAKLLAAPGQQPMGAEDACRALADCYRRVIGEPKWRQYIELYRPDGTIAQLL